VFNTVHQTDWSNAVKIADYVAVRALMIVLILWSTTRWYPNYLALAALITLILWATTRPCLRNASFGTLTQFQTTALDLDQ
jgi:hypothetical protein